MENINKKTIAQHIAKECGFSAVKSAKMVGDILDIIKETLKQEGKFKYHNFGYFKARYRKERMGRNPKTREEHKIVSKKIVSFYASKKLIEKLNS